MKQIYLLISLPDKSVFDFMYFLIFIYFAIDNNQEESLSVSHLRFQALRSNAKKYIKIYLRLQRELSTAGIKINRPERMS